MPTSHTDCRTEDGVTVGLIDAVISIARVLRHRNLAPAPVAEALRDLADDEDVAWLTQACADKPKSVAGTATPRNIVNIQSNCPPPAQVIVMNDPRMRA